MEKTRGGMFKKKTNLERKKERKNSRTSAWNSMWSSNDRRLFGAKVTVYWYVRPGATLLSAALAGLGTTLKNVDAGGTNLICWLLADTLQRLSVAVSTSPGSYVSKRTLLGLGRKTACGG
jgi:hypothetical protein